ncbi:hypothetical protein BMS3Abin17_00093 [archaeon BMS3Abin17]|nr:hypothetical protein BMS3Abin17_00093 [archaeon BMS3Abin17]
MKIRLFNSGIFLLTCWAVVQTVFFDAGFKGLVMALFGTMIFWQDEQFNKLNEKLKEFK